MGSTKFESSTSSTATPTPEETELNKRNLRIALATEAPQQQAQLSGLNLVNQLLTGSQPLPGFFGTMAEGITPETIGTEATRLAQRSLPQFQQSGLLDSGVMGREISRGIANELLFPAQQFNIGALQNLLNLALSGQAQVQEPIQAGVNNLSQTLAGLRSVTGTQSQVQRNPFLTGSDIFSGLGTGIGTYAALR